MIQTIGKLTQVHFMMVARTQMGNVPYGCPVFQKEEVC